jgi:hypothetical protein
MNRIINFLKLLLSDGGEVSSKRVAGFICLFNAIIIGYTKSPNESILNSFLLFSAGVWGLSVIDKFKKNDQ